MNFISSLKKSSVKKLHVLLNDALAFKVNNFVYTQWYNAAIDHIESKFNKPPDFQKVQIATRKQLLNFNS